MDPIAKDLIVDENFSSKDYNVIGEDMCMGDHKVSVNRKFVFVALVVGESLVCWGAFFPANSARSLRQAFQHFLNEFNEK